MKPKSLFPSQSILSPIFAVAANIVVIYILYSICRLEFLLENRSWFSQAFQEGRVIHLFMAGLRFDTPGIFYTNALYILLMLFPFHLKENRGWYRTCRIIFIVINSVAIAANLADSVYFNYTLKRTAWSVFSEFGSENFSRIIGVEIVRHWYLLLLFIFLVWMMCKLYVSPALKVNSHSLGRYYLLSILSLALAATITITGIRGGLFNHWQNYIAAFPLMYIGYRLLKNRDRSPMFKWAGYLSLIAAVGLLATAPIGGWRHRDIRPIAISNANAFTEQPVETALVLNTPFSMIRSIGNVPFHHPGYYPSTTDAEKIFSPIHNPSDTSVLKNKNVVIFIIESFGKEYIGAMNKDILGSSYKGFTPFIDSLLNHSAYWHYSYDNGQKSIDGMPSILAGIPMFVRPFIVTPQAVNNLQGLPRALSEIGYETAFFHGARTGSMGFDGFAKSIGFGRYHGREDFNLDKRFGADKDFDGYWAIWDEPFMQYFALQMSEMKQPFMTAIFTASNHHPFNLPDKYKGKFLEGTMKIHPTVGYTDMALREFFATAKKQPWYDNTIFIITNDHTNMRDHDEYRSSIGAFYGPIIIFDPSGEITPGERNGIAQQIDIMPTILNHLGYRKPYVAYGCDLLSTPEEQTWAVNYTDNTYQYVKYGYILLFNGEKTIGVYGIDDHLMQHNLVGKITEQKQMEMELKAIIQSYMDRMLDDRLMPEGKRE